MAAENCITVGLPLPFLPLLFQAHPRGKKCLGQVDGCAEPGGFPEAEDGDEIGAQQERARASAQ